MRIEEDLKLGFKDVLIRPKRSTLKAVPMLSWNVNLPLSIQVRPGPAYLLLPRTWTLSGRLPWQRRWHPSTS